MCVGGRVVRGPGRGLGVQGRGGLAGARVLRGGRVGWRSSGGRGLAGAQAFFWGGGGLGVWQGLRCSGEREAGRSSGVQVKEGADRGSGVQRGSKVWEAIWGQLMAPSHYLSHVEQAN